MKKTFTFISSSLIVTALTIAPAAAQSTSGQGSSGSTGSTQQSGSSQGTQPRSGTQSGQTSGGTASGQTSGSNSSKASAGSLAAADRTFLIDAMEGNRAEVELARLAQRKADSQVVRDLAKSIQQDHEKANQKLTSIAGKLGATDNAPQLKPEHKQLNDRLSKLDGAAFDSAYASEMAKEHQKDIAKYEKASRDLQQAELKAYATETLPSLKHHLEMSRSAQSQGSSPKTK